MKEILILDKRVSETPLECLERFRGANPQYQDAKMTYAGRLDPTASGLLVVLTGDMVHRKEEFLKLPKTYEATVVLGLESDTFDCLGIVDVRPPLLEGVGGVCDIEQTLMSFTGTYSQHYPAYSSKTINGKQMHSLARASELPDAGLPSHMVTVTEILNVSTREISRSEISRDVIPKIKNVKGDFRQEEILDSWEKLEQPHPSPLLQGEGAERQLLAVSFTISVSGGTYIRAIADELGKKLRTGGILWKLHRTKVGEYSL